MTISAIGFLANSLSLATLLISNSNIIKIGTTPVFVDYKVFFDVAKGPNYNGEVVSILTFDKHFAFLIFIEIPVRFLKKSNRYFYKN